jgi:hypothetical protein
MNNINGKRLGLTLGSFAAFLHLVWVVLVALKWAQPLSDFVHRMHFMNNTMTLMPFELGRGILLIVIAFIMGNIIGNLFAYFWNKMGKHASKPSN